MAITHDAKLVRFLDLHNVFPPKKLNKQASYKWIVTTQQIHLIVETIFDIIYYVLSTFYKPTHSFDSRSTSFIIGGLKRTLDTIG